MSNLAYPLLVFTCLRSAGAVLRHVLLAALVFFRT